MGDKTTCVLSEVYHLAQQLLMARTLVAKVLLDGLILGNIFPRNLWGEARVPTEVVFYSRNLGPCHELASHE